MEQMEGLVQRYGYAIIGIIIFLECMGIPFPGETILILGGVAASLGHLNIVTVILIAIAAAVLGDNIGYSLGKRYGRKIIKRFENFPLFHYKHIDRAEKFYQKHGNKTVFIGRFIAIMRTYAAVFAGVFEMKYSTFFFYNLTGGVVWSIVFGILGFVLGKKHHLLVKILSDFHLLILAAIVGFIAYKVIKSIIGKKKDEGKDSAKDLSNEIEIKL